MPDIAFPLDLIEAQRDWNRARAALVRRPVKTPELLNRLRTLGVGVAVHSFWETEDGKSPSAREDLRRRVSEMEKAEERLTDQQRRILTWVRRWVAEHGEAPTQRQIGQAVGLSSTGSVSYQLAKLEEANLIDRRSHGRGIALRW
ncbi:MarR family transcriptional regulator [Streptomyces sp. NPDC051172]|uniref:LexA family protein n=1 Tax=Streptomyces sp. NPDC051172 TaxID=3155796 RepID=UPI00341CBE63